jgi:hypothetical protein
MDSSDVPNGLSARGAAFYLAVFESNELDPGAQVLLEEAARVVDRLEQLHWILRGDDHRWIELSEEVQELYGGEVVKVEIVMANALMEARQQQLALRQILTTLGQGRSDPKANAEDSIFTRLEAMMKKDAS